MVLDDRSAPGGAPRDRLAALPAVDAVLALLADLPGAAPLVRAELDSARQGLLAGQDGPVPDAPAVAGAVRARLLREAARAYPPVVNATGVVLHTGLGRAPLGAGAAAALEAIARGWSLLEVNPGDGQRKDRESRLLDDLTGLTGADSGLVVNNNAAALLLILATLARGRDVIVSRGQLIEIGGGFRLPDLLEQSGARLVEVGTTNRTYTADVERVLTWETGLVLVMHTSNYRVQGFTHEPPLEELAPLCAGQGVPLVVDTGSGLLAPPDPTWGLGDEPDARGALAAGADLVCFSGDKLLGGPQAGLLVGRQDLVRRCRSHPLFRALRPDRLTLAALAATLAAHRERPDDLPVAQLLGRSGAERGERARALAARLARRFPGARFEVADSDGSAGSGSAPARHLASAAVLVRWPGWTAAQLLRALRTGEPSVFARHLGGQLALDVMALLPGDDERLEAALAALPEAPPEHPAAPSEDEA